MSFVIFTLVGRLLPAAIWTMILYALVGLFMQAIPDMGAPELTFLIKILAWFGLGFFVTQLLAILFNALSVDEIVHFDGKTTRTTSWIPGLFWYPAFAIIPIGIDFWQTFFA